MSYQSHTDLGIGLIGIGLLGHALAERLLQAGYIVHGFDVSPDAMERFRKLGGGLVSQPEGIPDVCRRVVLCLPNSDVVESVLETLQPQLSPGTTVIDTTTGDPSRTVIIARQLASCGVEMMDATVLGSSEVMRRGDAVIMAGASDRAWKDCQNLLRTLSASVHHVGPVGSGQQMKLVANLVLGLNRVALAEGLHFAKSLNLDLNAVLAILQTGATYSRVMDAKGRKMIDEDFTPQARLSQHLKDVRLILKQAQSAGVELPASALHQELLSRVNEAGDGGLDNSAVIRAWGRGE
jgi:3-hydroxyisobutyrate dehydrogenase-like beta-hydroxyacid dehydrogenase